MVVGNHLFSFFDKKFREGVTRYELHPPSLRTVYFPTAPFDLILQSSSYCPYFSSLAKEKALKTNNPTVFSAFFIFFN